LRVVFAGTPPFAVKALAAIHAAGHAIPLVLTQPDRPSGRGLHVAASAVGQWAEENRVPVAKPESLKSADALDAIRACEPDVMVVAAYGLILPATVLAIPRHGCINIHASLLPRWRGAAPIQRALLAGDAETGVCIMQMDAGLDTGAILLEKRAPIRADDDAGTLSATLASLGAAAIVEALQGIDRLVPRAQEAADASYAPKITKTEARIDWSQPAHAVDRQIRAFNPVPGAETRLGDESLKVWRARPVEGSGTPGKVLQFRNNRLVVACGSGALELLEIQRPGGRRLPAADFLRGALVDDGTVLGHRPLASP
jgi:methionyl-tRNA formyltransferase